MQNSIGVRNWRSQEEDITVAIKPTPVTPKPSEDKGGKDNSLVPPPPPVNPPVAQAAEATILNSSDEEKLTEVQRAEKAYQVANEARHEASVAYENALNLNLNGNEDYIAANRNWQQAYDSYYKAFQESGLTKEAFNATPSGKELSDKASFLSMTFYRMGWDLIKTFNATPSGKELFDKQYTLSGVRDKAIEVLDQARAKAAGT